MNSPITFEQLYLKAAALCSKSEKCSADMIVKLTQWGGDDDTCNQIIKKLQQEKFLDDTRYACYFVKDKFRFNHWGRIKITYMLRMKRLSQPIIEEALMQIDESDYLETLEKMIVDKAKKISGKNEFDKKARLLRFAQSHGFENELIFRILNKTIR